MVADAAGGAVGVMVIVWTLPVKVMMEAKGLGVQEVVAGAVVDDSVVMVTGLGVLVMVATVVALFRDGSVVVSRRVGAEEAELGVWNNLLVKE